MFDAVPGAGDGFRATRLDPCQVARVVHPWVFGEARGRELAVAGAQDIACVLALLRGEKQHPGVTQSGLSSSGSSVTPHMRVLATGEIALTLIPASTPSWLNAFMIPSCAILPAL